MPWHHARAGMLTQHPPSLAPYLHPTHRPSAYSHTGHSRWTCSPRASACRATSSARPRDNMSAHRLFFDDTRRAVKRHRRRAARP